MKKILLLAVLVLFSPQALAAVVFDGTNDCLSSASTVNFGTNIITVTFRLYWDSFANDDDIVMELSSNMNSNSNSFIIDPNSGAPSSGFFQCSIQSAGGYRVESCTRPSAAAWHHYAIVLDNSSANGDIKIYIDGAEQTLNLDANTKAASANFRTDTLYVMSRACSSLAGAGKLEDVVIFSGELTADEITLLYKSQNKTIPYQIDNARIAFHPLDECGSGDTCSTASMFKDRSGNGNNLSPSNSPTGFGTTQTHYA